MASNYYTQFKPVPGMALIDDWYDATTIDDMHPNISIGGEDSLNFENRVGQMFNLKEQLIDLLSRCSIKRVVSFICVKSSKSRFTVKCVNQDCSWSLHASVSSRTPFGL